jgi:UDP-N-acetylmuramoyl-L-alanyl-D-glutamate--2,6-diaminopimelate ligase
MTTVTLAQLLDGIADAGKHGDVAVSGLTLDSRNVSAGDAFFALAGTQAHGIAFAPAALEQGAAVVLAELPLPADAPKLSAPRVGIKHLRRHVGELAARFHGRPSDKLTIVGVTGTNGKTSIVQLLAQSFEKLGKRTATVGTLGSGLHGAIVAGERTTPDAISMQAELAKFVEAGATHVAMEVSSHALDQGRVNAVGFDVAVFTNLTRDHLDYHGTMEAYGEAKAKLFAWPGLKTAIINVDDPFGAKLARHAGEGVTVIRTSTAGGSDADVRAGMITASGHGLAFELTTPWGQRVIRSALLGRFNIANLLAVAATLGASGESFDRIITILEGLAPVDGRMNRIGGEKGKPLLVVDYAHTPDALQQALTSLRAHTAGKLICVFGCGGDRDQGKRPQMGAIAEKLADLAIVTDDNPRSEDGSAIVTQILAGFVRPDDACVERDREAAIRAALKLAKKDDVILVAGKGHETYQEGAAGRRPFDDMAIARAVLEPNA